MRRLMWVLAALLSLSGCSEISAQMQGEQVSSAVSAQGRTGPILVTEKWGVVDGMLSVVVTNTTDRTLRYADAVITARDAQDVLVTSSSTTADGRCCAVIDLPPGDRFGFYFDAGSSAAAISEVDVVYRDVAWAPPAAETTGTAVTEEAATFTARATGIEANSVGAVVVADVTMKGAPVAQATAQAFLVDADGEFLAVVSGRWDCFTAGRREIRMQFFHPLPEGTRVQSVAVHAVSSDPARSNPTCDAS